jgi:hypothetical protein
LRIHPVESRQNFLEPRVPIGCVLGPLHVSSKLNMRARFLLLAAALAAFGASLGSGFHFDDYAIFSMTLPAVLRQPGPLTNLTLWLNYQVAGDLGVTYHLINLLLHIAAVLLAYDVLRRWIGDTPALIAAAIFAVHPLQSEAVNYISARGALLTTIFLLWGARILAGMPSGPVATHGDAWRPTEIATAALFAVLALLSCAGIPHTPHPGTYILSQSTVIFRYLRLLIIPWGFTIDPAITPPPAWLGILAWLILIAAGVFLWRSKKPWAHAFLAGLILLALPSVFPSRDLAADYRAYPAVLAFAAGAVLLISHARSAQPTADPHPPSPAPAVAVCVMTLLVLLSLARTYTWLSDERLWREAVLRAPDKARPKLYLARTVRASEALDLLARARQLDPHDAEIPAESGKILLQEQQPEAALNELSFAIALDPTNAITLNNRGVALAQLGHTEAARADFEKALTLDANFAEARENLTKLSGR